jgi:hypothetical protein
MGIPLAFLYFLPVVCKPQIQPVKTPRLESNDYARLQRRLGRGWNTWDVQSVTTQVLLPEGLAVRVGFLDRQREVGEVFLSTALIGKLDPNAEHIFPGPHAFDGSYTDLTLTWKGQSFRVQSATDLGNLVLLVTPLAPTASGPLPMTAVFSFGFPWNRPGSVRKLPDRIEANAASRQTFFLIGVQATAFNAPVAGAYFAADMDEPVALVSGRPRSLAQVQATVAAQAAAYERANQKAGQSASIADAIQTVLGWDTIYDPEHERVISPVSRIWSVDWGGYVLFDWDTFFAASMAAIGDHDLAYADAIETLNESTPAGFVPNYARRASGRVEIAPNLLSARSPCWGFIGNFTSSGCFGIRSHGCWRGTAGGRNIATCKVISCGAVTRMGSRKTAMTIRAAPYKARGMNQGSITRPCMTMYRSISRASA